MPIYTVSVWDMDEQAWVTEFDGLSKWGLRGAIRDLRGRGYSEVSVAIDRADDGPDNGRIRW